MLCTTELYLSPLSLSSFLVAYCSNESCTITELNVSTISFYPTEMTYATAIPTLFPQLNHPGCYIKSSPFAGALGKALPGSLRQLSVTCNATVWITGCANCWINPFANLWPWKFLFKLNEGILCFPFPSSFILLRPTAQSLVSSTAVFPFELALSLLDLTFCW